MRIKFIAKPILDSQKARDYKEEISKLKKQGIEIEESLTEAQGENNARILARKAIEQGFNRIIFVGGDGILNEGVNGLMESAEGKMPSDFTIGIIPIGSGNDFAKALNIPRDIKQDFQLIKRGSKTLVDLGKTNERYFLNVISFGFDAIINKLANELKAKNQFLPREGSYFIAALQKIITEIPVFNAKIEGKEVNLQKQFTSLAINNGPSYGAIFKIAPKAIVNDGKFDICMIEPVGRLRALADIFKIIQGTHTNLPEITMLKSSSLKISSSKPLPYEMDGEVLTPQKEYKINVLPKALNVLTV